MTLEQAQAFTDGKSIDDMHYAVVVKLESGDYYAIMSSTRDGFSDPRVVCWRENEGAWVYTDRDNKEAGDKP